MSTEPAAPAAEAETSPAETHRDLAAFLRDAGTVWQPYAYVADDGSAVIEWARNGQVAVLWIDADGAMFFGPDEPAAEPV